MPPVIINLIAAQSGTGKTTIIEKLLPELTAQGLQVAALKGEVHHYNLDIPGKDTWRFARAGATVVGMITRKIYPHRQRPDGGSTAVAKLQEMDLIIIEGKNSLTQRSSGPQRN